MNGYRHAAGAGPVREQGGYAERAGSLGRVRPEHRQAVATARTRTAESFGARLHSAYLHGPLPLGLPGRLGLLLVLHAEPGPADRATAQALADVLRPEAEAVTGSPDGAPETGQGPALLLYGKEAVLSEAERDGIGRFLACRCVPLLGADLAEHLPRYRAGDEPAPGAGTTL
ncbi:hypothetical protein [Streptomyces sp. NPDC097619]|uniref:hypothetical protein n=1 Tax=Streptomyces sp. NPDC097619 TaxID=3157228 RepID=UPI003330FD60